MIPNELTQYAQWVSWRYENDGTGKPTKVPYHAPTGAKASVTDARTWCDFTAACNAMTSGFYSGIGFVLTENDPYTFIDLDDPYKQTGNETHDQMTSIAARHGKVLSMMGSYAEWSPSGKGMHIIVRGSVPEGRRRAKMEVYSSRRYMTVTGNTYSDLPIVDRSDILPMFYAELGIDKVDTPVTESPQSQSDYDIYMTASNATNGEKFLALWQGAWEGLYASQSEADFGLINMLGFYSRNSAQIERMFMSCGLGYRLATGQKKKAKNYISLMVKRSFDNQLPDIDISALKVSAIKQLTKRREIISAPAPEALKWDMPPGLVGEITEFIFSAAPLPVAEVALAGAFALMAGIVGRAYNVSEEGLNMYLLVLALTGVGKEAAAKGIGKLMDAVEVHVPAAAEFRGPAEIASGPGLTKHLADKAPSCFSILGEFGLRLHQLCNENAQSHMIGLRRVLLDLFHKSGKSSSLRPHVYSDKDKNTTVLYSPAYTIMGESTPETFYRHLDESMISDGLLPRFAIIEYTGDRVEMNREFMKVKPSDALVTKLCDLCTYCLQMASAKRVLDVAFTDDAQALYWELSSHYTKRINASREDEVARQLLNRAHIKIMKLAAIIAVGCNPIHPTITVENILWGQKLIDRDIANIMHKFQTGKVGRETGDVNQATELSKIIRHYITCEYDATLAKYKVMPEMKAANVIPYQYLLRVCGGRAAFRQDRFGATLAIRKACETLINAGGLREVKSHILEREFGTTMKAYAVVDPTMFS